MPAKSVKRQADGVPEPSVMPIDRNAWARRLDLSNFINTYCQYRDVQMCGNAKRILIIGPGQGLDAQLFRWREYDVTTFDIDETFRPDVLGSVHDLSMFDEGRYDVAIASHVLEHLPVPYLDMCLAELARISAYSLIYFPVAGRHSQMRLRMDLKGFDISLILDFFNFLRRPDGVTARYCQGQHYWEIGMRGYRVADIRRRLAKHFLIMRSYRNREWLPSYNFVLKSRRDAGRTL